MKKNPDSASKNKPSRASQKSNVFRGFGKFGLTSGLSLLFLFSATAFLHEILRIDELIAYVISIATVFTFNFMMLRYFVYPETSNETDPRKQIVLTLIGSVCFRLSEIGSFVVLHEWIELHYILTMIIIQPVSFILKYFVYRWLVFEPNRLVRKRVK